MPGPNSTSTFAALGKLRAMFGIKGGRHDATLSGALTLDPSYPSLLKLDPGGSARNVTLHTEAESDGAMLWIVNAADAAENLVFKASDGTTTIATANQNESAVLTCDGTNWSLFAIVPINLS